MLHCDECVDFDHRDFIFQKSLNNGFANRFVIDCFEYHSIDENGTKSILDIILSGHRDIGQARQTKMLKT